MGLAPLRRWRLSVLQEWTPEELIESWTLVTDPASGRDDWRLVGNKAGATRLGFVI